MTFMQTGQWQVYDPAGRRKYLTAAERRRFLAAADSLPQRSRVLCGLLAYAGCRISEALGVHDHQLDHDAGVIVLRTLKRRRVVFRAVPLPPALMRELAALPASADGRILRMHRSTAWRHVKRAMKMSAIDGPMATCRGLRHGFGMRAAASSIPPSLIARWLGHASTNTTAIYLDAVGEEEREFAMRMW